MNYWLLKSDPDTYSFHDLVREGRTVWDGVTNNLALSHIRKMKKGDRLLIYHTGAEKAIVGLAEVVSDPYPDPKAGDPKIVVVDIKSGKPVKRLVTLAEVKSMKEFASFPLVRMARLSVMPVSPAEWKRLGEMGGF